MRLGTAVVGLCLVVLAWPAKAATTGELLVPNPVFSTADAWFTLGCDPGYEDGPVNGYDSIVRTVSPGPVAITWSPSMLPGVRPYEVEFVSADCQKLAYPSADGAVATAYRVYYVPAAARWVMVHNRGAVNATVTIS